MQPRPRLPFMDLLKLHPSFQLWCFRSQGAFPGRTNDFSSFGSYPSLLGTSSCHLLFCFFSISPLALLCHPTLVVNYWGREPCLIHPWMPRTEHSLWPIIGIIKCRREENNTKVKREGTREWKRKKKERQKKMTIVDNFSSRFGDSALEYVSTW